MRRKRARKPRHPTRVIVRYTKEVRALFDVVDRIVRDAVFDGRLQALTAQNRDRRGITDEPDDDLDAIFENIVARYEREQDDSIVKAIAERYALETDEHSMIEHRKTWRSSLGIDVGGQAPHGSEIVRGYVRDNVKLIKTVQSGRIADVQRLVERHWRVGDRWETVAERIEGELGKSTSVANRIARDQIQKLNGELARDRQVAAGVTHFHWRTSGDGRVRSKHRDINGRVFSWKNGHPTERIPGWPIHCRCYAEPVFPDEDQPTTAAPEAPDTTAPNTSSRPPSPNIASRPLTSSPRVPAEVAAPALTESARHAHRAVSQLSRGEISTDLARGALESSVSTLEAVEASSPDTLEVERGLNRLRAAIRRLRAAIAKSSG